MGPFKLLSMAFFPSFFFYWLSVFQYIDGPVTLYFSIDEHFGGWSVLEVVNSAALKTEVKVSF